MSFYSSITNLNTIAKILERSSVKQIQRNMESTENIAQMQSAYGALHLIETAMARVVDDLLSAADYKAP